MARTRRVAALAGEGVGPEVVEAALRVLERTAALCGIPLEVEHAPFGRPALEACGSAFPAETAALCARSDGVLLGAVEKEGLLELRRHFDFFANLRPVRARDALVEASSLRPEVVRGTDLLFVRELTSGIHFGASGRDRDDARGDYGFHTMLYTDAQIRRIARVALAQAAARRGLLTVAHKENALPCIPWCALVREEAQAFPDVRVETVLVDTLSMQLVMEPRRFDVIVSGNLMGDWMSSLGAALVGSIGLLPSASLDAEGFGLYEPIHGTAPELAGRGEANPLGAVGSAAMMLRQWGEAAAATRIEDAVDRVLAAGFRTPDLGPAAPGRRVSTAGLTECLLAELEHAGAARRAAS